ncbi:cupredoxin domain-containing protein [Candidatus Uhrbacteria bacterium]|nr:cupredoxin domain-containing protein [Candidatus Uhrbacteria bacterium]
MKFPNKYSAFALAAVILIGAGCASQTQITIDSNEEEPANAIVVEDVQGEVPAAEGNEAAPPETPPTKPEPQQGQENQPTQTPPAEPEPEETRVTVLARFSGFEPSTIRVKKGSTVTLQALSIDGLHTYTLAGYNVNLTLGAGTPVTTEFVADTTGTFPFRCNFHGSMGGTLIVE